FWVLYDDLAPFLSKQTIMTSDLNNAATMSLDDFFTKNHYRGNIYKTTNMLGKTLAQYCETDSALTLEQQRIEKELADFEKNIFGDQARKDSLDSIAKLADQKQPKKKSRRSRRSEQVDQASAADEVPVATEPKARAKRSRTSTPKASSSSRMSVRRQRH
nr:gliding motility protein GldN [Prevotella sp.]